MFAQMGITQITSAPGQNHTGMISLIPADLSRAAVVDCRSVWGLGFKGLSPIPQFSLLAAFGLAGHYRRGLLGASVKQ